MTMTTYTKEFVDLMLACTSPAKAKWWVNVIIGRETHGGTETTTYDFYTSLRDADALVSWIEDQERWPLDRAWDVIDVEWEMTPNHPDYGPLCSTCDDLIEHCPGHRDPSAFMLPPDDAPIRLHVEGEG